MGLFCFTSISANHDNGGEKRGKKTVPRRAISSSVALQIMGSLSRFLLPVDMR